MDLVRIIQISGYLAGALIGLSVHSASVDYRIYDGYKTNIYDFPYQLSLHANGNFRCGAEIIEEHYALTAAHCVYNENQYIFQLRSGSSFRYSGGKIHKIRLDDIRIHEKYKDSISFDYDLALIYVEEPLLSKDSIARPVTLPNSSYIPRSGANAIVTGWGDCINCPIYSPEQLNAVEVPLIPWSRCKDMYPSSLTERMICTGYANVQKGTSHGDSGGPLVVDGVLIGVVSWGEAPFPIAENPVVFANVIALSDWIKEKIAEIEYERIK